MAVATRVLLLMPTRTRRFRAQRHHCRHDCTIVMASTAPLPVHHGPLRGGYFVGVGPHTLVSGCPENRKATVPKPGQMGASIEDSFTKESLKVMEHFPNLAAAAAILGSG